MKPYTAEALRALVDEAFPVFKKAGDMLVEMRGTYDGAGEVEKDEDGYLSVQTKADMASDAMICEGLARLTPDIPVVTEENVYAVAQGRDLTQGRFWIVDPMDGTAHFRAGRDTFAVLGALIEDRRPVLGLMYFPAQKDGAGGYFAVRGGGAYSFRQTPDQPQPLVCRPSDARLPLRLGFEGCYFPFERMTCAFPPEDIANIGDIMSCYQAGVFQLGAKTIAGIAENQIDFSAFLMDKCAAGEWDIAAPSLLLREAGGCFTDLYGREMLFGTPYNKVPAFAAYRSPEVFERFRTCFFNAYDDVQGVFVRKAA